MPDNVYHFMLWIYENTHHVQNNVKRYKGKMYFVNQRIASGEDGGLDDLWTEYIKQVMKMIG